MAQEGLEDIKFMDVQDIMEVNERDIAIIGISARLPKADTLEAFWENLVNERNCIDDIPDTRMKDIKAYLLKASEAARLKRRTLSTMDIGAHGVDSDCNGIPDDLE